jgi:cytochrome b561
MQSRPRVRVAMRPRSERDRMDWHCHISDACISLRGPVTLYRQANEDQALIALPWTRISCSLQTGIVSLKSICRYQLWLSSRRRAQVTAAQWTLAALAVVAGVLSLIQHSRVRQAVELWVNIHVLFGLLFSGLVIAVFRRRVKDSPRMLPIEARELSRHLSRVVYLLLYLVIGLREVIGVLNSLWHGGVIDFNLLDERFRHGPGDGGFNPKDNFHIFLACGLATLVLARVLAFRIWLRSVEALAIQGW